MFEFIVIVVVVVFIAGIVQAIHKAQVAKQQREAFNGNHAGWDTYVSSVNQWLIAVAPDSSQVAIGHGSNPKTYPITAIAAVEILKDGSSITSTNRGSQAAGALIGGLALGGVGLLLGGLSGSKRNKNTINSIALKIIVDDRASPVHSIIFFESPSKKGTDAHSFQLKEPLATVDKFHALLITGMKRTSAATNVVSLPPLQKSSTDELQKLWELKQAGALTDAEFNAHKAKLLAG